MLLPLPYPATAMLPPLLLLAPWGLPPAAAGVAAAALASTLAFAACSKRDSSRSKLKRPLLS
jgi:hypothetical protein